METMIAFFDVETTVPSGSGSRYFLLEFGAILVCPLRLVELENFTTLIRPSDLGAISASSIRCNGITRDMASTAPIFADVADKIFTFLHGKVWAGHNILRFDCPLIKKAFAEIGRPSPEHMGTIDTLPLLTQKFGRRAGNMKMATLASYFCLGPQKHRSLDDVRLNLEVLKCCATVLFLESCVSNASAMSNLLSANIDSEICSQDANLSNVDLKLCSQPVLENLECSSQWVEDIREVYSDLVHSDTLPGNEDAVELIAQAEQMNIDLDASTKKSSDPCLAKNLDIATSCIGFVKNSKAYAGFLEPDEVVINCITVSHTGLSATGRRMHVLHLNVPLWLCCGGLRIQFGINTKFEDHSGRPKLSILANAPPNLCRVLSACDSLARRSLMSHGSTSQWRPLLRKNDYANSSAIRLHIPIIRNSDSAVYSTDIYQIVDASESITKLVFNKLDPTELSLIFVPGKTIDTFFCMETYDYLGNAGIRLVAKCLVVYST